MVLKQTEQERLDDEEQDRRNGDGKQAHCQEQPDVMLQTLVRAPAVIMEAEANARCGAGMASATRRERTRAMGIGEQVLETRMGMAGCSFEAANGELFSEFPGASEAMGTGVCERDQ